MDFQDSAEPLQRDAELARNQHSAPNGSFAGEILGNPLPMHLGTISVRAQEFSRDTIPNQAPTPRFS
jgi:hypothetical protein